MSTRPIRFGTDGWRGVIGDDVTFDAVRHVAAGIAEHLTERGGTVAVVGYDRRFASEVFAEEVARVLAGRGIRALLFDDAAPTQVASWTVIERGAAGGAVVTASHNPYLFNGVKYKPETGSSAPPEVIADLERRINAALDAEVTRAARDDSRISRIDPRPGYLRQLARMVDLAALREAGLRVLHDPMHGSGAGYVAAALAGGPTTVTEIRGERNPFFGGVNPEPIPPNIDATLEAMHEGVHDLAILTDGDADRVGIVDETGRFLTTLELYALLLRYLVEVRRWRGPIVRSINMTAMADRLAARYQLPLHEVPIGFKSIAPKMIEVDAILGGEESGGYAIRGHIPERDGILVGLLMVDYIRQSGRPLSALLQDLHETAGDSAYLRHDVHLPRDTYDEDRARILRTLSENSPASVAGQRVRSVRDDDGYKFNLEDGSWVLLRASGTEPVVRVYSEAESLAGVEARLRALEDIVGIEQHG
ncbi:MAG: phosphoglucomutase/phosphomannomutase family protein [Candidatus Dormibacteraeota bacterium]|nr:phosphoglucomutase/phosphomannomutase family protein [Candidatus Dormibacteraeota bacterium]